jgi:hypothetical protein
MIHTKYSRDVSASKRRIAPSSLLRFDFEVNTDTPRTCFLMASRGGASVTARPINLVRRAAYLPPTDHGRNRVK